MDAYEEYPGQKSRGYTNLMYVNDTQIFKKIFKNKCWSYFTTVKIWFKVDVYL